MNFEKLLRQVGVADPAKRDQIVRAVNASASRTANDANDFRPRVGEIRATLERHLPQLKIEHNRIIRALVDGGHVAPGEGFDAVSASAQKVGNVRPILTVVQAAQAAVDADDENRARLLQNVIAQARRLGYDMPLDKPVSMFDLDHALAGKDIGDRMALKANMARLSLIPQ